MQKSTTPPPSFKLNGSFFLSTRPFDNFSLSLTLRLSQSLYSTSSVDLFFFFDFFFSYLMENVSLIDIAAEDEDLLFATSVAASFEALENCGPASFERKKILTNSADEFKMQLDHAPVPFDSMETKRGSSRKFNFRKSLAWDSAFFTCEGVLDPEELAIVNTISTQALPGVHEDMRKSIDSNVTFDSDGCTVESIETSRTTDLRSLRKCNKESTKDRFSSRNMKQPIKTSNEHGSKQAKKENSNEVICQRTVNTNGNGALKSSMKPPGVSYGMVASNRKPSAPMPFQGKEKTNKASAGYSGDKNPTTLPKKIAAREPHSAILKSSSTKLSSTCSTCTGIKKRATDIKNLRKKIGLIGNEKSTRDTSNKSPAKLPVSEKEPEILCRTSQHSSSIISSSASPNRSFDSMASDSSFSSISLGRSSSCSTDTKDDISGTSSFKQSAKNFSLSSVSNDSSTFDSSRCQVGKLSRTGSKISGLRMPSPKVGYFDTEKSVVCDATSSQKGSETSDHRKTRGKKEKVVARPISSKVHDDVLPMTSIPLPGVTGGQIIIESSEMTSNFDTHSTSIKIGVGIPCEAQVEMKEYHEMKDSDQNQPNLKSFDKSSLKGAISQQAGFDDYTQEKYVTNSLDGTMASDL